MQAAVPHPVLNRLTCWFIILILALPITYLQITRPSWGELRDMVTVPTAEKSLPQPVKPSSSIAKPVPQLKTAHTTTYVNVRSGKGVETSIIGNLEAGASITLRDDADVTWQGVTYQGKSGYIYRSYLQY